MAARILTRTIVTRSTRKRNPSFPIQNFQSFSSNPPKPTSSQHPHDSKAVSLNSLLQRYGFPSSLINTSLSNNQFLLDSDLHELQKSLVILLSFKIPHNLLVSLICDCPGVLDYEFLKKWEMGLSNLGLLSGSPLMIKSILEQSKRFEIDPDSVFRSVEALRGFGFKDVTVSRVLEGFSGVFLMNEREIQRRIEFMVVFGIPRDVIDMVLCCFPGVLGFGVEHRLKPLLCEFKSFGFSEDVIRREIIKEPRILGMELGEFSWCLEWLRTLKCRIRTQERIFSEGEFRAGFEVKKRVDCLCRYGLIRTEAFEVLWKEPRSIIYKVEEIERKIEFLIHTMKLDIRCLVEVPEYLGVNIEKQIIPRYNVIEHLRSKGGLGCEVGLKGLIKPSRLSFYNVYVKPYPDCEKIFGRFSGDGKVRNQYPTERSKVQNQHCIAHGKVRNQHRTGLWKLFSPSRTEVVQNPKMM